MSSVYIKKPIAIEALLWDGEDHRGMYNFLTGDNDGPINNIGDDFYIDHGLVRGGLVIKTSEGEMVGNIGDYIIKEPFDKERGFYPCKPDIFKKTYYTEQEYAEFTG